MDRATENKAGSSDEDDDDDASIHRLKGGAGDVVGHRLCLLLASSGLHEGSISVCGGLGLDIEAGITGLQMELHCMMQEACGHATN